MKPLLAALSLAVPALATAHDLWVEREPGGFVARHGHRGGRLLPVGAGRVGPARCVDGAGASAAVPPAPSSTGTALRFDAACAVISVHRDGGFWSLTPDGEVNLPRTEARQAVRSWASRQWAKWVDARSPRAAVALGDGLELVPVSDLARARRGDKVTLRVLSAGRPVPGAAVASGHRTVGETDSRGEIRLRLRADGVESVSASVRRPLSSPEAEVEVLEASLTFEVAR